MPLVTTLTHTNGLSRGLDLKVGAGLKVFRVKNPTRLNRIWETGIGQVLWSTPSSIKCVPVEGRENWEVEEQWLLSSLRDHTPSKGQNYQVGALQICGQATTVSVAASKICSPLFLFYKRNYQAILYTRLLTRTWVPRSTMWKGEPKKEDKNIGFRVSYCSLAPLLRNLIIWKPGRLSFMVDISVGYLSAPPNKKITKY